jgi:hypothetical protein
MCGAPSLDAIVWGMANTSAQMNAGPDRLLPGPARCRCIKCRIAYWYS